MGKRVIHHTEEHLEQEELQRLAKSIIDHAEVVAVHRSRAYVFRPDGTKKVFDKGSKCVELKHLGFRYWVHLDGCKVTEIIESY